MRIRTQDMIKEIDEIKIKEYIEDSLLLIEIPLEPRIMGRITVPEYVVNDLLSKGYADLSTWV